ncbi:MAG: iron-containing alcohol dehydrogenase [Candidatus Latescibacteria bacterium]|nr:iron-containing alcohol dehydrogenase [Candidatus Latescibacterota bacterium]
MAEWNPNNSIITMDTVPIRFGIGATEEIAYEIGKRGIKKVMLVSDPHLREIGLLDTVEALIRDSGVSVVTYDKAHAEPSDLSLKQALSFQEGVDTDGYVALGGGSTIDTAKAMNLYGTYPAPLQAYINKPIGEGIPVRGPLKPLIAVPTTAGTGSESTTVIIMDLLDLHLKTGISHPYIRPTVGIIDHLNTITMPPVVTASTGLAVLCHALESYISLSYNARPRSMSPDDRPAYIGSNPVSDLFCREAITLASKYLRRAYFQANDLEARSQMLMASTLAGFGFGNAGVHIPHAMGYPVAGMIRDYVAPGYPNRTKSQVPHGMSCIVNAPASFRFTFPAWPERHEDAARMMGVDTSGMTTEQLANAIPDTLIQLMKDLDMPNGLKDLNYQEAHIPSLVDGTLKQQRLLVNSPRPVTPSALENIFRDAMSYW